MSPAAVADAIAAIGAGAYTIDGDGRVTAINAVACDLLGRSGDEVLGNGAHGLFHFLDSTGRRRPASRCPIVNVAATRRAESADTDVFVRGDGTLLAVAWTAAPVAGGGALVVFHDVTGRRAELRGAPELQEIRRHDALATAEAARTVFLTDVTLALTSTLDVEEALGRLARVVVPRFADWCVVDLLDDDVVRRVTVAHREPWRIRELGHATAVRFPLPGPPGPALARVLRGGPSVVVEDAAASLGEATEMERRQTELFGRLGAREALIVGLAARTRTIGAITLVRTGLRHFTPAERALAEDIALRGGIAVDNARLYTDTRSTAEALQRSLLPTLPFVDGLHLSASYTPAGRGAEVGGDWYDAYRLPDGATGVVLGDVVGHDLRAASHMGDIRSMLRAASLRTADPAEVLGELDAAMDVFVPGVTATAVYGRVEAAEAGRSLRWCNAGHPAPLLVRPDGSADFLDRHADLLLGALPGFARSRSVTPLPPGSMVVLYSDGLVEDRTTGLEPGMERLRATVTELAPGGPDAVTEHLVDELERDAADDIAVLVVGVPGS